VRATPAFRPFVTSGRRAVVAILVTLAAVSSGSVLLSIRATARSQHRAAGLEVAARQRTLAERYVNEVLLARSGAAADPGYTASLLEQSARVLLSGGKAPGVNGDDDEAELSPPTGAGVRAQLVQQQRLVRDLAATGRAILAHRPVSSVKLTANEHVASADPVERLRVLSALTANVALNATRTIATRSDRNVNHLITLQVTLGALGLLISLLLAWALIAATRRQTAHFRSLVTSSTDLVMVFQAGRCRYVSQSVLRVLGRPEGELLDGGFDSLLHPEDRALAASMQESGEPSQVVLRMLNRFNEWRYLDAHVTDLRGDRHVRGMVLNARDVSDRVRLEGELTRQAFHDGLTGLANRALFRDRLDQALARSVRSHEVLSVLLVDLDGFKQVNDTLGHDTGDQLLQSVARRFDEVVRPADTLARLGGDEFALLLDGAGEAQAESVARRLIESVLAPLDLGDRELTVNASVGVVVHLGGHGESDELIRHADIAMYAAKDAGGSSYRIFRQSMAQEFGEMLEREHELRDGIERGELTLHYQPEIDLTTRRVVGVEALVRWESPQRGTVPPGDFIPLAEATGLIMPIGELVLRDACRQTAEWRRQGIVSDSFVTWVNLSGRQLSAGGVSHVVRHALEEAGLPAAFLGLEVTETAIVPEGPAGDRARAELQELHEQGVRIAIDDFGTGFSSLGQLRRFPIDVIKVDRSFVQGIEHDARDAAITANLVTLAHALGLLAIAEGIESGGQLASVRELGCDLAQGFLFARPVPAAELGKVLADGDFSALIDTPAAVAEL
jgi:diguanylate cyclase (GGDEF)-like protein/PAS domain S-box-containing protein